jgi:hypothetical protein
MVVASAYRLPHRLSTAMSIQCQTRRQQEDNYPCLRQGGFCTASRSHGDSAADAGCSSSWTTHEQLQLSTRVAAACNYAMSC